tara:strand:+ start:3990 stop:4409 length:420 start_codon:yes stop_codon:yes gene_type:complete
MKIDIVGNSEEAISGYKAVVVNEDGFINMFDISDSECLEIRANGVVDKFKSSQLEGSLASLLKKIRLGGKLSLRGLDCNVLSRQLISGQIDERSFGAIVEQSNSISSLKNITRILKANGLKIQTQKISGYTYEIVAVRG